MKTVPVKILGYKHSQRYPIWRMLQQAQRTLEKKYPGLQLDIQEIKSTDEILAYTPVIAFPSLMVNGKLVCVGRFPRQHEVAGWLDATLSATPDDV